MTIQEKNEIAAWLLKEWGIEISSDNELLPIYHAFKTSSMKLEVINNTAKETITNSLQLAIKNITESQDDLNKKLQSEIATVLNVIKKDENEFLDELKGTLQSNNVKQYHFNQPDTAKAWWRGKTKFWLIISLIPLALLSISYYAYLQNNDIQLIRNLYNQGIIYQNEYGESYLWVNTPHESNTNQTGFELYGTKKKITGVKIFISNKK